MRIADALAGAVLLAAGLFPGPAAAGDGAKDAASAGWSDRIECGPLVLEVHFGRTAHLFHVVDQLSAWSEFCHGQYRTAMPPDAADLAALARHAAIRGRHPWGGGLEQSFYVPGSLEEALRAAVAAGRIDADEAATEKEVFARFEARVDDLLRRQSADVRKSLASLDREAVTRMAKSLSRLCEVKSLVLPVYLLASPPPGGGGGYNGGRIATELCQGEDAAPTLVHEVVHAFLDPRKSLLEKCAAATEGLDEQTLNEGIAYAVMPGIFSSGKEDRLGAFVAQDIASGAGLDQTYPRFRRLGLALRPVVREALEKGDLPTLLARARDVWLSLREVEGARSGPRIFSAGPGWEVFQERMRSLHPGIPLWMFNHSADAYAKHLGRLRRGDLVVLLFAADRTDRDVPPGHEDLLPLPLAEVWKEVEAGRTVEREGEAHGARIVLLAAPTKEALERLIRETKTLAE